MTELNEEVRVSDLNDILMADIKGFVTSVYEGKWWLACVLETFIDAKTVKLSFLHPAGPSPSFRYPSGRQDILEAPSCDILTLVSPSCPTGRVYYLTKKETEVANRCLSLRK